MPRHSREDDRRRSSPYDSSNDRRSHHHQHKVRDSDDKGFRRKEWNANGGEKHQHRKQDAQTTARYRGKRSNDDDYGNRGNQESSRYHKHGKDLEKHYRPKSPSQSDDISISKRTSGFDVAPPVAAALPNSSGNIGLSCPAILLMGLRDVEYMPTRNGCSSSRTFSSSTATIVIW